MLQLSQYLSNNGDSSDSRTNEFPCILRPMTFPTSLARLFQYLLQLVGGAPVATATVGTERGSNSTQLQPQELSSKDAYMLIYTRRGCNFGSCVPIKGDELALPEPVRACLQTMAEQQQAEDREEAKRRAALKVCLHWCLVPLLSPNCH
jgi:hypothetical protein